MADIQLPRIEEVDHFIWKPTEPIILSPEPNLQQEIPTIAINDKIQEQQQEIEQLKQYIKQQNDVLQQIVDKLNSN